MSSDDFIFDDEAVQKEKAKNRRDDPFMKIDQKECFLLILPPIPSFEHKAPFIENAVYKIKINGKFYEVTSPENVDEEDPIKSMGFKLYEFFKNSKNKERQNAWQDFKSRSEHYANAIKLKKTKSKKTKKVKWTYLEAGPVRLPKSAYDLLVGEIDDSSTKEVCHPDQGRIMVIRDNEKTGMSRRYEEVKFLNKPAKLLERSIVDMEELKENMVDLQTLIKPYKTSEVENLFKALQKKHSKLIKTMKKKEEDMVDESEETEEEGDDIEEYDESEVELDDDVEDESEVDEDEGDDEGSDIEDDDESDDEDDEFEVD